MGPQSSKDQVAALDCQRQGENIYRNVQHRQSDFYDSMTPMDLFVLAKNAFRNICFCLDLICFFIYISRKLLKQTKERLYYRVARGYLSLWTNFQTWATLQIPKPLNEEKARSPRTLLKYLSFTVSLSPILWPFTRVNVLWEKGNNRPTRVYWTLILNWHWFQETPNSIVALQLT